MNNDNKNINNTHEGLNSNAATKFSNNKDSLSTNNNFNKNYRKANSSASTRNNLKKDTNINSTKASRIRNAFNNVKQRRANALNQSEIDEENLDNNEKIKKGKIAEEAEKKKKKILAKVTASFFASNIFIGAFAVIVIAVIFVMALPLFISILSSQVSEIWDNFIGGFSGFSGVTCTANSETIYPVDSTPLSRDEFIEKVKSYNYTGKYSKYYQVFKDNAGVIYDIGVREGVNPEFCVIRAFNEGFSPMSQPSKTGDNNYWGINCTNGSSKCRSYASFEKGVEGFYSVIKNYEGYKNNNIYQVMGKYAWIGDRWYYPGNSSLGGCYYANNVIDKLNKLGFDDRADEVRKTCSEGTQIPTQKDTDQIAYAYYQVEQNIIPFRKNIFGLGEASETACLKTDATLDISSLTNGNVSLTKIKDGTIADLLLKNGSSIDEFNLQLLNIVKKDGIGTRKAAVDISKYTVNTFASYGYAIPYLYYGGHYTTITNASNQMHNFPVTSYYGLNPYFGEEIYYNGSAGLTRTKSDGSQITYQSLGLDCSGYVTWALHNAGINIGVKTSGEYLNLANANKHDATNTSEYIGQPGDVFACNGHVALNIEYVGGNDPYYIVIEEAGHGLAVNKYKVNGSYIKKYKIVDMSYYYENAKTENFESLYRNGLKKY